MNVFVGVERGHIPRTRAFWPLYTRSYFARSELGWGTYQNVHLVKHTVGSRQLMGDSHPMRLHEMAQAICVCTNVRYRVALD